MSVYEKSDTLQEELKKINAELRKKELRSFYFLYGNEDYLIDEISLHIRKTFSDDVGLNYKMYTEENFNISDSIRYIEELPLMNDKKLVFFKDIDFFRYSGEKDDTKHQSFITALSKAKENNIILIIDHNSRDKDDKYQKYYNDNNSIAKFFKNNGVLIDLFKLDEATLNKYIVNRFAKAKKIIDKLEAAYIIRNCGTNLKNLYNECDKVIAFVEDKVKITREDIDSVVTSNIEDNVFNLISLINTNKYDDALKMYGDLITAGRSPDEIAALLVNNYKNLLVAKGYIEKSKSQNEIAKLMGQAPWQVSRLMSVSKFTTKENLENKLNLAMKLVLYRNKDGMDKNLIPELLFMS